MCILIVLKFKHVSSEEIFRFSSSINCSFPCRNIREIGNELKGPSQADDITWRQLICLPFADASISVISLGFPGLFFGLKLSIDSELSDLRHLTDSRECANKGQVSEDDWRVVVTEFLHYQEEPASGWSKHAKDDCYSEEKRRH